MHSFVIDASVVAKWYIQEILSEYAEKIREDYINRKIILITPSLLPYEVLNALIYSNLFNNQELYSIGQSLENYGIDFILMKNNVQKKMIEIAKNHKISIYDAAYVALSIEKNIKMITADTKIRKKLPKTLKERIINLEDYKFFKNKKD